VQSMTANKVLERWTWQYSWSVEAWKSPLKQLKTSIPCAEFRQSLYYGRCSCAI